MSFYSDHYYYKKPYYTDSIENIIDSLVTIKKAERICCLKPLKSTTVGEIEGVVYSLKEYYKMDASIIFSDNTIKIKIDDLSNLNFSKIVVKSMKILEKYK